MKALFYFPTAKKDEGKPRPFRKFLFPSAEQPIDDPHQRSRKYAVDDNGSRHDEHFCRKPVNPALRLELDGGRTDAVCKPRNGHDRPRARVSAYPVVNAQSRQQRAEKNEQDADRARKFVPRHSEQKFQHIAEKLSDTADKPADAERAQTIFEMMGGGVERVDVSDIIFIVVFPVLSRHRAPPPSSVPRSPDERTFLPSPPAAEGKQLSRSSRVLNPSKIFTRFISIIWGKSKKFIPLKIKNKKSY